MVAARAFLFSLAEKVIEERFDPLTKPAGNAPKPYTGKPNFPRLGLGSVTATSRYSHILTSG